MDVAKVRATGRWPLTWSIQFTLDGMWFLQTLTLRLWALPLHGKKTGMKYAENGLKNVPWLPPEQNSGYVPDWLAPADVGLRNVNIRYELSFSGKITGWSPLGTLKNYQQCNWTSAYLRAKAPSPIANINRFVHARWEELVLVHKDKRQYRFLKKRLRPYATFMDSNSILPCSTIVQMQIFLHYGEGHEPPKGTQFDAHEPK